MPKHVTVAALAAELEMDKSALRKAILKLGLSTTRVRSLESRGQAMLALTEADAETIRKHYSWRLEN